MLVEPRVGVPELALDPLSGTPSRASSTACAWRSWCGAKRRRMPAWAASRRNSTRAFALDQGSPRVGPSMTQNTGPIGSSTAGARMARALWSPEATEILFQRAGPARRRPRSPPHDAYGRHREREQRRDAEREDQHAAGVKDAALGDAERHRPPDREASGRRPRQPPRDYDYVDGEAPAVDRRDLPRDPERPAGRDNGQVLRPLRRPVLGIDVDARREADDVEVRDQSR